MKTVLFFIFYFISCFAYSSNHRVIYKTLKKTNNNNYNSPIILNSAYTRMYLYDRVFQTLDCSVIGINHIYNYFAFTDLRIVHIEKGHAGVNINININLNSKDLNNKDCWYSPIINIVTVKKTDYQLAIRLGFRSCNILYQTGGGCYPLERYSQYLSRKLSAVPQDYVYIYKKIKPLYIYDYKLHKSYIDPKTPIPNLKDKNITTFAKYTKAINIFEKDVSYHNTIPHIVVYLIKRSDLPISLNKGFKMCAWFNRAKQICYPVPIMHNNEAQETLNRVLNFLYKF